MPELYSPAALRQINARQIKNALGYGQGILFLIDDSS